MIGVTNKYHKSNLVILCLVWFFTQSIEIVVFNKKFLCLQIKIYNTSNIFLQNFGSLEIDSLAMLWTNLCAL